MVFINKTIQIKNGIFDFMKTFSLIGIGIGFCPLKIKKLFVQLIDIKNPQQLFTGISIIIAKSKKKYNSKMSNLELFYFEVRRIINK